NQSTSKKPASSFAKKKEEETNAVSKSYLAQVPYFPYLAATQHQSSQGYPLPQAITNASKSCTSTSSAAS
ncbi:hypothetical protein A2U01_0101370, partial [Trifolium medium]|nr:hypothetical protein [Trifolium medium]